MAGAIIVCDGILDLRYRDGLDTEAGPLEGVAPVAVTVTLGPTAMRFRTGHAVRLEVSSSNFPRFARHPNTTASRLTVGPDDLRVAHQTLYHDAAQPSALRPPRVPLMIPESHAHPRAPAVPRAPHSCDRLGSVRGGPSRARRRRTGVPWLARHVRIVASLDGPFRMRPAGSPMLTSPHAEVPTMPSVAAPTPERTR